MAKNLTIILKKYANHCNKCGINRLNLKKMVIKHGLTIHFEDCVNYLVFKLKKYIYRIELVHQDFLWRFHGKLT